MEAAFDSVRLLDSQDLLDGVNPFLKWLINAVITNPAYQGLFAKVRLTLLGHTLDGFGNFESMVFRNK